MMAFPNNGCGSIVHYSVTAAGWVKIVLKAFLYQSKKMKYELLKYFMGATDITNF